MNDEVTVEERGRSRPFTLAIPCPAAPYRSTPDPTRPWLTLPCRVNRIIAHYSINSASQRNNPMSLILIVIVLVLLFGGGGFYGHRQGYYGNNGLGGIIGLLVVILVVLFLFGGLGRY